LTLVDADTNNPLTFVLTRGAWLIRLQTRHRLYLVSGAWSKPIYEQDYITLVPSEYYTGSQLKHQSASPCPALQMNMSVCLDMVYPPWPSAANVGMMDMHADNHKVHVVDLTGSSG
jgi:hypothetical protein